jgi:thioredoxin reductase (NADPH)
VKFLANTVVEEVYDVSKNIVTGARLRNVVENRVWDEPVDGFFLAIGHIPNTKPFVGQIDLDPDGYIVSKGGARTNLTGVFHAGDVQDRTYRPSHHRSGRGLHGGD